MTWKSTLNYVTIGRSTQPTNSGECFSAVGFCGFFFSLCFFFGVEKGIRNLGAIVCHIVEAFVCVAF